MRVTLLLLLLSLVNVAHAATAQTFLTDPTCTESLTSTTPPFVRAFQFFAERSGLSSTELETYIDQIVNAKQPIDPWRNRLTILENQLSDFARSVLPSLNESEWRAIKFEINNFRSKRKVQAQDAKEKEIKTSWIARLKLVTKEKIAEGFTSSRDVQILQTPGKTLFAVGILIDFFNDLGHTLLFDFDPKNGHLRSEIEEPVHGGIEVKLFAHSHGYSLATHNKENSYVSHFDKTFELKQTCHFPENRKRLEFQLDDDTLVHLSFTTPEGIIVVYKCTHDGKVERMSSIPSHGFFEDYDIFKIKNKWYLYGSYVGTAYVYSFEPKTLKLIEENPDHFYPILRISNSKNAPEKISEVKVGPPFKDDDNNLVLSGDNGRLESIHRIPGAHSKNRPGTPSKPQLIRVLKHDYVLMTSNIGFHIYRYDGDKKLTPVNEIQADTKEQSGLVAINGPNEMILFTLIEHEVLSVYQYNPNLNQIDLVGQIPHMGDDSHPRLIAGTEGQVYLAVLDSNHIRIYSVLHKLESTGARALPNFDL